MSFSQPTTNYWKSEHYQPSTILSAGSDANDDMYNDICELNHENVTLFNDQQQNQQPVGDEQYPFNNSTNFSTTNDFNYMGQDHFNISEQQHPLHFSQGNHPNISHSHKSSTQNNHVIGSITSNGSSPIQVNNNNNNHLVSPQTSGTSETSGNYDIIPTKFNEPQVNNNSRRISTKSKKQLLDEQDAILIARDDSELNEEELQLKRKAQNRAAQRAFRERKETKLKELETKLLQSEEERQRLIDQLDSIRKQNLSITSENDFLRNNDGSHIMPHTNVTTIDKFNFPQNQQEFIAHIMKDSGHTYDETKVNAVYNQEGEKLLALGAVWDYLQIKAEEANLDSSSIDFTEVMSKLKGNERCHGYGPAYSLNLVNKVIKECIE
ncbi:FCR3 [Candida pseudojiufengensis]|uniref:FCR3 n=1 Tax=Candida pseudojiufengensis TaxID=497109 RepID=UPI0022245BED|nr:FCR3 [Candida pseudojiufengensis]KAI5964165.1 FCR3 [Candida pseudojiufengensis]